MVLALDMAAKGNTERDGALIWLAILTRIVDAAFVAVIVYAFAQAAIYWPTTSALELATIGALLIVFFAARLWQRRHL